MSWDETYDLVIVGSGGGAVVAALRAHELGLSVLIVEKQKTFGGSSCYSGGVLWIANNPVSETPDSDALSQQYMDALIGEAPGSTPERRRAFVRYGSEAVALMMRHGMRFIDARWPDYYGDVAGASVGRSIVCPLFDERRLGEAAAMLNLNAAFPIMPVRGDELALISIAKNSWKGRFVALKIGARLLYQKLARTRLLGTGAAFQGQALEIALRENVPIWVSCPLIAIEYADGAAVGVTVTRGGRPVRIAAHKGIVLNTGGFSHNLEMRQRYQPQPTSIKWTASNPGDTGEAIQMAMKLGAAVEQMDEAWWTPGSLLPDGTLAGFHVPLDTAKPHCIVVDASGRRFANEACSYMEFGQRMYANQAVPAWAIIESRHRRQYFWGFIPPGKVSRDLVESGYFKVADTLDALAETCGIDKAGLAGTVARFNEFCRKGEDDDFRRGTTAYHRYQGDRTVKPNACLGAIEQGPFYAVALYPSDVGTCGGLMTDENARVLREDGTAITGLYATGNSTASVMGRTYTGAGATIGPAFVFGYIAAGDAARR